jgi:hypothetical protein
MSDDKTNRIDLGAQRIREQYKWREIASPVPWRPEEVGTELVGFYGGKTMRTGKYGQYEVAIIHVPMDCSYMVTGTRVIQLVDASLAPIGHPIRIVWQGYKETGQGHNMKMFDVLVADGVAVPADALPVLQ